MHLKIYGLDGMSQKAISSKILIDKIERYKVKYELISDSLSKEILDAFDKIISSIQLKTVDIMDKILDIDIILYIFSGFIISNNGNGTCDGFAYHTDTYKIVVSANTDIISVLYHELCHIILRLICPESTYFHKTQLEQIVEFIEVLLCAEILGNDMMPSNPLIQKNLHKYSFVPINLAELLKEEQVVDYH